MAERWENSEIVNVPYEYGIGVEISDGIVKLDKRIEIQAEQKGGKWVWSVSSDIYSNKKTQAEFERARQQYLIVQVASPETALRISKELEQLAEVHSIEIRKSKPAHWVHSLIESSLKGDPYTKEGEPLYSLIK